MSKEVYVWAYVEFKCGRNDLRYDRRENFKLYGYGGQYTLIGLRHPKREGVIKVNGILDKRCVECGGYIKTTYGNKKSLIEKQLCFKCELWDSRFRKMRVTDVIINGNFYGIGNENAVGTRGFGGKKFVIEKDGEIIETTNLWHGGDIPKHFRDRLVDNAKFVK